MYESQKIFHITHLSNLQSVITAGCLLADSLIRSRSVSHTRIGYEHIKQRRLERAVDLESGGFLGDYVPFNFCPRSVMLYVISIGQVPGYDGGQEQIVHLVSRVGTAINLGTPWGFTDRHAELGYALYFDQLTQLDKVDWTSISATQWGGAGRDQIKERKQAEFLVYQRFPWEAVEQIGVKNEAVANQVNQILSSSHHKPDVLIQSGWYY